MKMKRIGSSGKNGNQKTASAREAEAHRGKNQACSANINNGGESNKRQSILSWQQRYGAQQLRRIINQTAWQRWRNRAGGWLKRLAKAWRWRQHLGALQRQNRAITAKRQHRAPRAAHLRATSALARRRCAAGVAAGMRQSMLKIWQSA